jgi:hypothetical protein
MLTLTMTDALGRSFSESSAITAYPIPEIELALPQTGYAGEAATISVDGTDLDNLTSLWTVSKDGSSSAPYTNYTTGSLDDSGGSITFGAKGNYMLTVTVTDTLGRAFSRSAAITIYPFL